MANGECTDARKAAEVDVAVFLAQLRKDAEHARYARSYRELISQVDKSLVSHDAFPDLAVYLLSLYNTEFHACSHAMRTILEEELWP